MIRINELYPIYFLVSPIFPDPYDFYPDGFVGVSMDLDISRLINGYMQGFFPWYQDEDKLFHWYHIEKRMILYTDKVKKTKNLRKKLRSKNWEFKINSNFDEVIKNCATIKRPAHMGNGSWITKDFIEAYTNLYNLGYAISVESYFQGELVGGFYGVKIGNYFSGESMFAKKSDASKLALIYFCDLCIEEGIGWIDCQSGSDHLLRMGAEKIKKTEFLEMLKGIEWKKSLTKF